MRRWDFYWVEKDDDAWLEEVQDESGKWVLHDDAQAAIAEAEARADARGYARGVEDAARWHDVQADAAEEMLQNVGQFQPGLRMQLIESSENHSQYAAALRSLIPAERTANDAPATGHASNAAE